jgi:hypothetical protein
MTLRLAEEKVELRATGKMRAQVVILLDGNLQFVAVAVFEMMNHENAVNGEEMGINRLMIVYCLIFSVNTQHSAVETSRRSPIGGCLLSG